MLDPTGCTSLGSAIQQAAERFAPEVCLIEANRDRENVRLTYGAFMEAVVPVAAALQELGISPDDRVAIIMSNQSKWLIAAQAVFQCGATLVPLDYKLTAAEHVALLKHCGAKVVVAEYPLWMGLARDADFDDLPLTTVITEAPSKADVGNALRWEACRATQAHTAAVRQRTDLACIVYSSGTGGQPKGCMLTHGVYLEQVRTLMQMFKFSPGDRYLSILPTNHAIDFMVGFIGPFLCGATVVHLRTLRPEFIRDALTRYGISYMSVVPMILKNLEAALRERFAALGAAKKAMLGMLIRINRLATRRKPRVGLSRRLLPKVHHSFGGHMKTLFVGGAFTEPSTLQFFYDLGIPVANGYGLTEAGTAITLNDLNPFRPDTVGTPLPGVELRIVEPGADGIGQVTARSATLMSGYLDDPEQTARTLVDGWLMTGDLGHIDATGHLRLVGRQKNMIVTPGGKNIYPEDIENALDGLDVKEYCVFAADYVWPRHGLVGEQLIVVLRPQPPNSEPEPSVLEDVVRRNRRLLDYKRVSGYVVWPEDFPRTASLKIKRGVLAEAMRQKLERDQAVRIL
jgi:long-chain acyl-CoA synthetase